MGCLHSVASGGNDCDGIWLCYFFASETIDFKVLWSIAEMISFDHGGIAVVFGASGEIGHALKKQLEASLSFDHVIGLSRQSVPGFDLLDEASIEAATSYLTDLGEIRLIVDATGFLHDHGQNPEKSLRELDAGKLLRAFALNAIGPSLIMKHLLPKLPREG